jgi:hypothetical protein
MILKSANMPPSAQINDTTSVTGGGQNGAATTGTGSMSTLPQEGHNWQITLASKVIASKFILVGGA